MHYGWLLFGRAEYNQTHVLKARNIYSLGPLQKKFADSWFRHWCVMQFRPMENQLGVWAGFWKLFSPVAWGVHGVWSCGSRLVPTGEVERWTENKFLLMTLSSLVCWPCSHLLLFVMWEAGFSPARDKLLLLVAKNIINNAEDKEVFLSGKTLSLTQGKRTQVPALGSHLSSSNLRCVPNGP